MQVFRKVGALVVLGVVMAACGGQAATQAPAATQAGGGGGGGGSATEEPAATQQPAATDAGNGGTGGNGGGGVDTSLGKAHVDITGPATKSTDLGFAPVLSHFGGTDDTVLYFVRTDDAAGGLVVTWASGTFVAVFTSTDVTVSGGECTVSNVKLESNAASGSFDCPTNVVALGSGGASQNAGFKGTFDAHP